MTRHTRSAQILSYWRAVEMFSPPSLPKVNPNPRTGEPPVFGVEGGDPLPWEPAHPLSRRHPPSGTVWRHLVYIGIHDLGRVREVLEVRFGKDPESFDERSTGEGCVLGLAVTDRGRPLFDSVVLASSAWAVSRTLAPGPDDQAWLVGFEDAQERLKERIQTRFALAEDDEEGKRIEEMGFGIGRVLVTEDLRALLYGVLTDLGVHEVLNTAEIRIRTSYVGGKKCYSADDQDMLNSFFLRDLERVARDCTTSERVLGRALTAYLEEQPREGERADVRKSPDLWTERLSPRRFPVGRWPSKGHHPLVFSQQLAVNDLWEKLERSGLYAINGPPGTGKTTLLRDLIAAVVVERARALSRLSTPGGAFTGEKNIRSGKFWRKVSLWKPGLTGYEIVVASSNNGAVENVTLEIPGQEAIDGSWRGQVEYFADLGSRVIGEPAWGLFAAPLGNKENRSKFVSRFWFDKADAVAEEDGTPTAGGMQERLKEMRPGPGGWKAAVSRFKETLAMEDRLRRERVAWAEARERLVIVRRELPRAASAVAAAEAAEAEAQRALSAVEERASRAEAAFYLAGERRQGHRRDYFPRFLEIVFSLGRALREWRAEDGRLAASARAAEKACDAAAAVREAARTAHQDAVGKRKAAQSRLHELQSDANGRERELEAARDVLGAAYPEFEAWVEDDEARERASPWADREWNDARARVFLEAVELHRAFLASNAEAMSRNLNAAVDILGGRIPPTAAPEALMAAWASLFFVVPVISSTFASFDRLFAHLGRESIGWLLIDEAGQAVPQAAAGAIWRAERVVVVGDPLQLEPVVTIPYTVQQALRRHYAVSQTWVPGATSAQQLADRVASLGTRIDGAGRDPVWVGSPLRVHRRCDREMFDISNRVAYDGMMVFGTGERTPVPLAESAWLDVRAATAEGHWVPDEGQVVRALLNDLVHGSGVDPAEIFLISPFRVVVRELDRIARQFPGTRSGTIHRVQGKEADVVVLVLGGDPKRPGAKEWASEKPNLVNVAASRARRRLYVVGDRAEWMRYRYFDVAADVLPSRLP